jgi:hypothetical protein
MGAVLDEEEPEIGVFGEFHDGPLVRWPFSNNE